MWVDFKAFSIWVDFKGFKVGGGVEIAPARGATRVRFAAFTVATAHDCGSGLSKVLHHEHNGVHDVFSLRDTKAATVRVGRPVAVEEVGLHVDDDECIVAVDRPHEIPWYS